MVQMEQGVLHPLQISWYACLMLNGFFLNLLATKSALMDAGKKNNKLNLHNKFDLLI